MSITEKHAFDYCLPSGRVFQENVRVVPGGYSVSIARWRRRHNVILKRLSGKGALLRSTN